MVDRKLFTLAITVAFLGCGGGEPEAAAPAGAGGGESDPGLEGQEPDSAEAPVVSLEREIFTYRGGERDPFLSLVRPGGEDRPRPTDLRITSIVYDPVYPVRSIAVARDTSDAGRRYELRVDDVLGRFRVTDIRANQVVVTIEEFGTAREVIIPLRSRQEVSQ